MIRKQAWQDGRIRRRLRNGAAVRAPTLFPPELWSIRAVQFPPELWSIYDCVQYSFPVHRIRSKHGTEDGRAR
ncbi:hypothetical protein M513_13853 [Trichuris suis]|uniref:Uncharacterized protein n=1 Tax=Trichuris suis TaxID=68888 RepID=A0A085LJX3_9BILA|nr:hypothetical protein M513_13853 [Trichuris suis]